jgi:uncharacterized metal-binding protein YceD (DUF177 family)
MPPKTPKPVPAEWSHFIEAEKVGPMPMDLSIEPDDAARKRLAQRLNIKSLESLKAKLSLMRESGKMTVYIRGQLKAEVKQLCVVTGKPVADTIEEEFEAWFADRQKTVPIVRARHEKQTSKGKAEKPILDESEDPEPIIDGQIDLGELVTQYLSLGINPYPHAEGVEYEGGGEQNPAGLKEALDNPFAALKDWKARKGKDD